VIWGPYQALSSGVYEVQFYIAPLDLSQVDQLCCTVDVARAVGEDVLFVKDLTVRQLTENDGIVMCRFTLTSDSIVEFRVIARNGPGFRVRYYRKVYPVGGSASQLDSNHLYTKNIDRISQQERFGVKFWLEDEELIAGIDNIEMYINNDEDLILIEEIFFANDYNIVPSRNSIAIDVGMNVGMASLTLASNPKIDAVFSYEPFLTPFHRAVKNFRRNPLIKNKITTRNVGLSDGNRSLDVKTDYNATIGTSIRGVQVGETQTIQIRDAAEELQPIIEQAARRELGVLIKVDCEGSEFAIFDSLGKASLFHKIDAVMMEWHKWWSADKTQADLIRPLTEAGFAIFDRTNRANPHAGLLLAVRSAS
jgi:FkbM family methyltransferase